MKVTDFDFELPRELIAQVPADRRESSRLLVLDRDSGLATHRTFGEFPAELHPGDLLVLNDTKVLPARLWAVKATGGRVEILLAGLLREAPGESVWRALISGSKSVRPGAAMAIGRDLTAEPLARRGDSWEIRLRHPHATAMEAIESVGEMPLPPYIRRELEDTRKQLDRERYQTVYARAPGAIAAPTAGLHLTRSLLASIAAQGVATAYVTLHVGLGTFLPVRTDDVESHPMHEEEFVIPDATAQAVRRTREAGGRVVAVGTTVARTLEARPDGSGGIVSGDGRTSLFIYPGFRFRAVDALLTNFHLPQSTLLMLVCAFAGTAAVLDAYADAVRRRYRFFSYGDAMFVRSA